MGRLLDRINKVGDVKKIRREDQKELAKEIRKFLIEKVSCTGGHLASNLGAVELTLALHIALDLPDDKIIWDVGHQSYTHKLLTGRKKDFDSMRSVGGMSGFPKRSESDCDAFNTGHSSTSISAAIGYCRARDLKGEDYKVVAVIGDGSMTGGMAYEALNDANSLKSNLIIILNDNEMSINKNVGGLSKYLHNIRTKESYYELKEDVKNTLSKMPGGKGLVSNVRKSKVNLRQKLIGGGFFEDLGINYMGPIDGHDIGELVRTINAAKRYDEAVLIHIVTKKGKGYEPAEKDPASFHGVSEFNISTGKAVKFKGGPSYTDVFSVIMNGMAKEDPNIVAVCAAMKDGVGLKEFAQHYTKRFFDVGIAEQHAVTMSAGLAAGGLKPYVAIYSSFLQRAYDQIVHDVCMQKLPVTFCIDRAGIVGADGETHQGIMDLSFLSMMPNMTVMAPKNKYEFFDMMQFTKDFDGPIAIRYPRGTAYDGLSECREEIRLGKSELLIKGNSVAIVAVGNMVKEAITTVNCLKENGIDATLINGRFIKPIDTEMVDELVKEYKLIVTMEENLISGGFGEAIALYMESKGYSNTKLMTIGIDDKFVEHGDTNEVKKILGIDGASVAEKILGKLK